jgi:CheY-like chemotaxis protein
MLRPSFRVRAFENGAEALTAMTQERPDLVLLDISLPGMDGMEVLRRVRSEARLRDVPVVAVSAHAMAGDRERFLSAGSTRTWPSPSPAGRVSWP